MSFILIGDRIINLMAIVSARYIPINECAACTVVLTMVSGEPIVFAGGLAFELWGRLAKAATPFERF